MRLHHNPSNWMWKMVLVPCFSRLDSSSVLLSETALKQENKVITCVRVDYIHCLLLQEGIMSVGGLILKRWRVQNDHKK